MDTGYTLCIIKPNKESYSETFIKAHVDLISAKKKVLYGGVFPVYDHEDKYIIKGAFNLLSYLVQKKIFHQHEIKIRTKALANYLKLQKTDVVLAEYGMVGALVTEACRLANVPLVIHFHGADAYHKKTIRKYSDLYKKSFKYASAIVVVSVDMANKLKELGAAPDKIFLNPYGVDTSRFSISNVPSSGITFLAVGRFVEKKSPISVVKAFNKVVKSFPNAHLYMVGEGPLLEDTKRYVNETNLTGNVTFTGALPPAEVQKLMQKTQCFLQHSVTAADGDMEGTPNTILEASASGLAIVSTLHAGIKEAVIDGVTGFLTAEHDIEAMAERMIKLAQSPELAVKLGKAGREHMIANYNIKSRIALLDNIIQKSIK